MNEETLEYLNTLILTFDKSDHGMQLSASTLKTLSYSLKHLVVNELRTDAKYELAKKFEEQYGIR